MDHPRRVNENDLPKLARCDRCKRRLRNKNNPDWNVTVRQGVVVGFLCPDCQSPEENAEAVIKEATIDYYQDHEGRLRGRPKGGDPIG
ncbi:hypothetical protein [Mycobacterium paraense]|uniref:hypothetical protein n=1 Tax=Mycobacterium paraense TaxID=767916 RepID=UPI000A15F7F2|nr:hypothetical protein [Mycobacterium paraense]